jgi:hypothetical protein
MRVTAIPAPTARNRLDRSVSSAEKRRRQARKMRVRGPIRPDQSVCATTDTAQEEKRLFKGQNQAILTSDRRPLGECRLKASWLYNFCNLIFWVAYAHFESSNSQLP